MRAQDAITQRIVPANGINMFKHVPSCRFAGKTQIKKQLVMQSISLANREDNRKQLASPAAASPRSESGDR